MNPFGMNSELEQMIEQKGKQTNPRLTQILEVGIGNRFTTDDGRAFLVTVKRRTRFECIEIVSGKKYLFPGIYEVLSE